MKVVTRLFVIIFSRYRRKLGDSRIDSAWYQANNRVAAYMSIPILAIESLVFVAIYMPVIRGTVFDDRRIIILSGTVIFVITSYVAGRGFRRFLMDPPPLVPMEPSSDSRFVFFFRAISFGMLGLILAIAFALHQAGFPIIG